MLSLSFCFAEFGYTFALCLRVKKNNLFAVLFISCLQLFTMNNFFLRLRNKLRMPLGGNSGGRRSTTTEYEGLLLDESDERKSYPSLFIIRIFSFLKLVIFCNTWFPAKFRPVTYIRKKPRDNYKKNM